MRYHNITHDDMRNISVYYDENDLVDYFAVSSVDEFLEIKNIVTKPILILEPIYENITKIAEFLINPASIAVNPL